MGGFFSLLVAMMIGGAGLAGSVRIINQGNEALIERLGSYDRKLSHGLSFTIPFIERIAYKETIREKVLDIPPQQCITRDNVSISVDAVVYWRIMDLEKAYYKVQNLQAAMINLVLTQIRAEMGKLELDQTFTARSEINEVLLREDLSEDELIDHLREMKAALPGVPVGYVDAYFLFEKHPRVTAECDVVMTNCYPFWEGCPREQALPYMQTMLARTRAAAPGKRILISETGWPDQGSAFHGAVPGIEAAMQYFVDTAAWAEGEGIEWFHFAAFDEAWKVGAEGDVGAFWGLWDKDARPKFA